MTDNRGSAALRRHVPALDGMRAVDVAVVLMFHGQVATVGGFLGVSQFFTLSGFLVMSILLRSLADSEGPRLVKFWGRRYRRLMPASLLTLAGVVVFGFTVATEQQVDALQTSIPAALAQVVNWTFVFSDASYVDLFQTPSPIQHFWSLAVEEQFYILVPLLVFGLSRITKSPRVLGLVLAGLTALSAIWGIILFESDASVDRIYYGTDTRAGEMLIGGVLAVVLFHYRPNLTEWGRRILGFSGAAAMGIIIWAFITVSVTDAVLYRGGFLAFAILSCVVIYSMVEGVGPLTKLLSFAPLTALGRISYGTYLFHWPLMLVLTEERVGLDGWWLFSVQAGTTIVLATISSRLIESPIRYGTSAPRDIRLPVALLTVIAVIAVGAVSLGTRDVETDLAGLGEQVVAPPTTMPPLDGSLRVVLIADEGGLSFADGLARSDTVDLVATIAFDCGETTPAVACEGWSEWTNTIETTDPDVVLFHVTTWDRDEIATRSGIDDGAGLTAWSRAALSEGFDLLNAAGATIVWGQGPADMAAAVRAETDPFTLALRDLSSSRIDVRRLGVVDDLRKLEDDLALYARRADADLLRVLVIGDSVSRTIGYGLERWTTATGDALVWSAGTEGCGIARGGFLADASGREMPAPSACDVVPQGWAEQIDAFGPDLVVVASNAADFRERRVGDWPARLEPGDPRFDDYLVAEYVNAYDILSAGGAAVTWLESACAVDAFGIFDEGDGGSAVSTDRILYVNHELLPRVVTQRPALQTFDLFDLLCPDGEYVAEIDGVGVVRTDGIHFSPEGSLWLAETYGPALLATAPK
jgi:peptidoglycan/LPS O-acetylase OafA/YrhL